MCVVGSSVYFWSHEEKRKWKDSKYDTLKDFRSSSAWIQIPQFCCWGHYTTMQMKKKALIFINSFVNRCLYMQYSLKIRKVTDLDYAWENWEDPRGRKGLRRSMRERIFSPHIAFEGNMCDVEPLDSIDMLSH